MENLIQPTLLLKPFAENGQRNTIPENATGTNQASLDEGFPPVTAQNPRDGGIPPTRLDFNGLGYLTTTYDYFYQAGGCFTFNQVVSDAIGGYPLNARLWYLNENGESSVLRSTKENNTDNFLTDPSVIGDSWVYDVVTTTYVKDEINEIRTNCITEIPQDIKLELNNGTLVLKAGSKVYVPNGFESDGTTKKFDVITIESDMNFPVQASVSNQVFPVYLANSNEVAQWVVRDSYSGNTAPTVTYQYNLWYDTATNKMKHTENAGATWSDAKGYSLPLCLATMQSGNYLSINQVFNGFGYIGAHGFILPGVKCLIPNGRNTDGTLKNIEFTTTRVNVRQYQYAVVNMHWWLNKDGASDAFGANEFFVSETEPSYTGRCEWYKPSDNLIRYKGTGSSSWTIYYGIILTSSTGVVNGSITSFNPKTTFHAVDYYDFVNRPHIVESYKNGNAWYRVWSDGWVEQGGQVFCINTNSDVTVTLLKAMRDTQYSVVIGQKMAVDIAYRNQGIIVSGSQRTTGFVLSNRRFASDLSGTIDIIWEVRGMGA